MIFKMRSILNFEVMLRKKAVGTRTKPTLSDIFPFINRIVYIELCSLHAVIGGLLVYSLPYFGTTFKKDSR